MSVVETVFSTHYPAAIKPFEERIGVVLVENYAVLGQLTALRFLEWVMENPEGVIALPTGKTPEYFIKWVRYYLNHWPEECQKPLFQELGWGTNPLPRLIGLRFVQLDEFFPMNPKHERSFGHFIGKYYIQGFGLDVNKALLMDSYNIRENWKTLLGQADNLEQIFPEGIINLGLRTIQPSTEGEAIQKKTIQLFDQFCENYENNIRSVGGFGFFLGGIGPDGHIAFNVKGSSHFSHTRLTNINYETMAAAAPDLGGIESVRKKAVITIGLETICYNTNTTAIIAAAGQANAGVVADAIQNAPVPEFPASALQRLKNARFFLTQGAASKLEKRFAQSFEGKKKISEEQLEYLIYTGGIQKGLSLQLKHPYGTKSLPSYWQMASKVTSKGIKENIKTARKILIQKIERGLAIPNNQRILHTAPHHDDIELAYFPLMHHLVRSPNNQNHFCYCTSGFTSVTNIYIKKKLFGIKSFVTNARPPPPNLEKISNINLAQEDIHGFLNAIAVQNVEGQQYFLFSRLVRMILNHFKMPSFDALIQFLESQIATMVQLLPGQPDTEAIKLIKSWIREWEAELVWAHFGLSMDAVSHLRLNFYTGAIFPEDPDDRDVQPILQKLECIRPTVVTLALDPESSGPDTHFKTMMALTAALSIYMEQHPESPIRIWGYRNVWTRFELSEVNTVVPVSLNSFAVLHNMFNTCFESQTSASFPSYELDGSFSQLAQKIWAEQMADLMALLGKEYFYKSDNPLLRRAYGAIYIKDMSYKEFQQQVKPLLDLKLAKANLAAHI